MFAFWPVNQFLLLKTMLGFAGLFCDSTLGLSGQFMSPSQIPNPVSNKSNIMCVISNIHYVLMNNENRRFILNCNFGVFYLENVEFSTPSRSPARSTLRTAVFL